MLVAVMVSAILATTTPSTTDTAAPWLTLVNFGVLGLVLFFTFFKPKIHTDSEFASLQAQIDQLRAERDREQTENVRLHKLIEEGVIPALSRTSDLIARSIVERSGGSSREGGAS